MLPSGPPNPVVLLFVGRVMVPLSTFQPRANDLNFLWLQHGGALRDPKHHHLLSLAASEDADIAYVDRLRTTAEPLPPYAIELDDYFIHALLSPCHVLWPEHLQHLLALIGNERPPMLSADARPDACGTLTASRAAWTENVITRLDDYLAGVLSLFRDPLHTALGRPDHDKLGAVLLLRHALAIATSHTPDQFEPAFAAVPSTSLLAEKLRPSIAAVRFRCGYRWELTLHDICHAIGDVRLRRALNLTGPCDHQLTSVHHDDPVRVENAASILIGLWSFLVGTPQSKINATYPAHARAARRVRFTLGDETPAKRWLAGRTFISLKIWLTHLQTLTHTPTLTPLPTLTPPLPTTPLP